jgi:hypothetical protein
MSKRLLMREVQTFVMNLGICNKRAEVNMWQAHSQQERRSYSNILGIL